MFSKVEVTDHTQPKLQAAKDNITSLVKMCGERQHKWSVWWTASWENTTLCGNQHWEHWGLLLRDTGQSQTVPVSCLDKLIQSISLPQGRLSHCWLHHTWLMFVSPTVKNFSPSSFYRQLCPCCLTLTVRNKFLILSCHFRLLEKDNRDICKMWFRSSLRPTYTDCVTFWGPSQPHVPCFLWLYSCSQENYVIANHLKVVSQHEAGGSTKRWQWGKCHTDATKVKNML